MKKQPQNGYRFLVLKSAILFLITISASGIEPQDQIAQHRRQLESIRLEIANFEQIIRDIRASEEQSVALLETLDRQTTLIRSHIRNLRREEHRLISEVDDARKQIASLQSQLDRLREHYAGYVVSVYKRGMMSDVEMIFASGSVNQFIVRAEYLKRFSDQRRKDLQAIIEKQIELERQRERLEDALAEQRKILQEKQQEEKRLTDRTVERRTILNSIRQNRSTYEQELARKQLAEQELRRMIAELIERERIRSERRPAEIIPPDTPFASLKGKLPWPVRGGQIASRFGQQVHPVLRTVTENTGIDIAVQVGSPVYAVSEGEVAFISWLPSYGNLVILHHFNGYRTVYANLSDILVAENERVKGGDMIGLTGESVNGAVLHFEIWKDRDKQNPEAWLGPQ